MQLGVLKQKEELIQNIITSKIYIQVVEEK